MDELADWGNACCYYLFVIDENNRTTITPSTHAPALEFKLKYLRTRSSTDDRVSKPIFGLPLNNGKTLVIQLPHQFHPAKSFAPYSYMLKAVIALIVLRRCSPLLWRKSLQQPLDRLREASRRLAQGDFGECCV